MVWVIGAGLVVAVIIIAINGYAPGTVQGIWDTLTSKIQTMLSNIS
jgi:Flp pilus assembly pilin Flp